MATAHASLTKIEKHLECGICLYKLENPRELVCHHIFCKSCLDVIIEFDCNGGGIIKCPHKCLEQTVIGTTGTTNDLHSSFYIKNILDELDGDDTRPYERHQCATNKCDNTISTFCTVCKHFMCKSCELKHDANQTNHTKSFVSVSKDNMLSISCADHNTVCEYMCCESEVICIYCVKRRHLNHHYQTLTDEIKKIRNVLDMQIQKLESIPQILRSAKEDISKTNELFEETIKSRKISCLSKYVTLLNKEEKCLREKFNTLTAEHLNDLTVSKTAAPLKELLRQTDFELAVLKENILENTFNLSCSMLPCRTVYMQENNFLHKHPLGEIVSDVKEVDVNEMKDISSFIFNVPESYERKSNPILLQKLDALFQDVKNIKEKNDKKKVSRDISCTYGTLRETSLHTATIQNNLNTMKQLSSEQIFVSERNIFDYTILHYASCGGSVTCLKWICTHHPHLLNLKNMFGNTALHVAVMNNHICCVEELCKHNVDMNVRNNHGHTALDIARANNSNECLEAVQKLQHERKDVVIDECNTVQKKVQPRLQARRLRR